MTEQASIRVVTVDDHMILRSGLRLLLLTLDDMEMVGEAHNGEEAQRLCDTVPVDVMLMDIMMPGLDGVETTRRIKARHPQVQVLILTGFVDSDRVRSAMAAGASGYLLKGASKDELAAAIRAVHAGEPFLDVEARRALFRASLHPTTHSPSDYDLSDRQLEVLALIAQGESNKEIAETLNLSPYTVRYHVSEILGKLGASSRAEAAALAVQRKLIKDTK